MMHYLQILTTSHLLLPSVLPGLRKVYYFDLLAVVFESKFVVISCCCFSLMDVGCGRSRFRPLPGLPSVWPHPALRSLPCRPTEGEHEAATNTQAPKADKNKHETTTNTTGKQTQNNNKHSSSKVSFYGLLLRLLFTDCRQEQAQDETKTLKLLASSEVTVDKKTSHGILMRGKVRMQN